MAIYKESAYGPVKVTRRPKRGPYVTVKIHNRDLDFDHYWLVHQPSGREVSHVMDLQDDRKEDRLEHRIWKMFRQF